MKYVKSLLLTAGLLALNTLASADAGDRARSVVVRYSDLNLNSQAGIESLHRRIRNAAQSVCQPLESRILGLNDAYDRCVAETLANSVATVGNARLDAFHARRASSRAAS